MSLIEEIISKLLDPNGSFSDLEAALKEVNVPVRDENGDIRTTYAVLRDLSDAWERCTK